MYRVGLPGWTLLAKLGMTVRLRVNIRHDLEAAKADLEAAVARIERGTPALLPQDDSYVNHVHADDLARMVVAALHRGQANRSYNASDDAPQKMGDYFDLVADRFSLPRPPRVARADRSLTVATRSARTGTAISAAAVGVGARRSATKSAIVESVSWPTPLITGMVQAAIARATASSLNAIRSSSEPPPRATMIRSGRGIGPPGSIALKPRMAAATSPALPTSVWMRMYAWTTTRLQFRRRAREGVRLANGDARVH